MSYAQAFDLILVGSIGVVAWYRVKNDDYVGAALWLILLRMIR